MLWLLLTASRNGINFTSPEYYRLSTSQVILFCFLVLISNVYGSICSYATALQILTPDPIRSIINVRADSGLAPRQRETSLQSNAVSHWLSANLESALNAPAHSMPTITSPIKPWV